MSNDLIQKIKNEHDPNEVVEALELTTADIVDAFLERVESNLYKFKDFADEETDS